MNKVPSKMVDMNRSIGVLVETLLSSNDEGQIRRLSQTLGTMLGGRVEMYSYNGDLSIVVQPNDGSHQYRIISSDQFLFPQNPIMGPGPVLPLSTRDMAIGAMRKWRSA